VSLAIFTTPLALLLNAIGEHIFMQSPHWSQTFMVLRPSSLTILMALLYLSATLKYVLEHTSSQAPHPVHLFESTISFLKLKALLLQSVQISYLNSTSRRTFPKLYITTFADEWVNV